MLSANEVVPHDADIELVTPDGSVREEITFSLRRGTRASLNIP